MKRLHRHISIEPLDSFTGYLITDHSNRGKRYEVRGWGELIAWLVHQRDGGVVGETIRIQIEGGDSDSIMWEGEP